MAAHAVMLAVAEYRWPYPIGTFPAPGRSSSTCTMVTSGNQPIWGDTSGPRWPSRSHWGGVKARSWLKKTTGSEACWR